MKRIADTSILFLTSSFIAGYVGGFTDTVVIILISLILTASLLWVNKNDVKTITKIEKSVLLTVFVLMLICWCVEPDFMLYAPILVYSVIFYNRPVFGIPMVMLMTLANSENHTRLAAIVILSVIAAMLAYSTRKMEVLESDIRKLRDTSIENDIKLKEKNRQIIINQDNEIHLATLKERNRIAREIHDNVGHMITRSILQVGALATVYREEPLHSSIKEINDTLNVAMNNIRESVHDIHDESVDLRQAIVDCTKEVKENYNLKMDYDMSEHIPKDIKYSFIAIVKEAMSNIVKHSNGTDVYLRAREHPGFYQLIIENNEKSDARTGFKEERQGQNDLKKKGLTKNRMETSGGIGLINMRERVESLGGQMLIQREVGFKIFITVPKK